MMASSDTVARRSSSTPKGAAPQTPAASGMAAWWVMAVGWLFPGCGYFVHQKWVRGGLVFVCVVGMYGVGLALHGQVYAFNTGDVLQMLGWAGDFCSGVLYFFSRIAGAGTGSPSNVMADYGTNFLIAAGLLNLLAAADARDVYLGKKK